MCSVKLYLLFVLAASCLVIITNGGTGTTTSGIFTAAPYVAYIHDDTYRWKFRSWWYSHYRLLIANMTLEILKDAEVKMIHANSIKSKYEHSITYQIGLTAASIMDRFEHMLVTYRMFANLTSMKKRRSVMKLQPYNEGLMAIQGDYHQIRIEQHLFDNIVDKLRRKREKMKAANDKQQRLYEDSINKQLDKERGIPGRALRRRSGQNQGRGAVVNPPLPADITLKYPSFEQNRQGLSLRGDQRLAVRRQRHHGSGGEDKSSTDKPLWVYKEPVDGAI